MRRQLVALLLLLLLLPLAAQQPSPRELFERARILEESNRSLDEAVAIYGQLASQSLERELAAAALVRMGLLLERLGRMADAQRVFQMVVDRYADQTDLARQARLRLSASARADDAPAARRMWAAPDVDLSGGPSPDGRRLSYVDWQTGDLAVRDLVTGTSRRLTRNPSDQQQGANPQCSAFSPDGREVAYGWWVDGSYVDLRIVPADGGGSPRTLMHSEDMSIRQVAWSGDGKHLAVLYQQLDRTHQFAMVSVVDGAVRRLKTVDWRAPAKITLSPDGRHIVYDFPPREDSPYRDLYILATDGSSEATLVEHDGNDLFPLWTPDGQHVVFVSDRTGTPALWIVRVEHGRAQGAPKLVQPIGNVVPLGFSRNGILYYGLRSGSLEVYVAALDTATGRLLEPPTPAPRHAMGTNQRPHWSPDGRSLAFQSDRVAGRGMGSRFVSILNVESAQQRDLLIPLIYFQQPRWSPDGQVLLVGGESGKGAQGFFRIDVVTGETSLAVPVTEGNRYGQTWAPDGRSVFFTGSDSTGRMIVQRNLDSGEQRVVYRGAPADAAASPDGNYVAFREGNGIKVVPVAGGDARELARVDGPDIIPAFGGINWTPDGRYLLFVRGGDGPFTGARAVWRVPVAGGEPQKTELTARLLRDTHLHPDGRRIAFTAVEGTDEVWALDNFLPTVP